jgi:hypothetical protein
MPASRCARSTATASRFEFDADGLLAVCVQHEMDHLLGKVFVEYLSPLKRDRIKHQDAQARATSRRRLAPRRAPAADARAPRSR